MDFSMKEFPAMRLFAAEAAKILARGDVKNYMSVEMHDDNGNLFELRMQRVEGKTPGKIADELRARLAEVEAQRDVLKDALCVIADDETDYPRTVAREALAKLEEK